MGELLYSGKVKQVWSTDYTNVIEFRYTNQISVFDQIIPSLIPHKGESLNRTSCHWFKLVEEADICDIDSIPDCDYIINTAAETHVGNSILDSKDFLRTNIEGVKNLLELILNIN